VMGIEWGGGIGTDRAMKTNGRRREQNIEKFETRGKSATHKKRGG